jgi:hypothetical protein
LNDVAAVAFDPPVRSATLRAAVDPDGCLRFALRNLAHSSIVIVILAVHPGIRCRPQNLLSDLFDLCRIPVD